MVTFLYVFLLVIYAGKLLRFPEEVKKEWCNPIKINFMAAITIATTEMAVLSGSGFYNWLAGLMLFVLSGIICVLIYCTLLAIKNQKICLPEH